MLQCSVNIIVIRGSFHVLPLSSLVWLYVYFVVPTLRCVCTLTHHMHVYHSWLCSSSSLLHESALCRIVHKLMKKLFMQLISEFKRLGSTIVYADFSKIVVCTKKKCVEDASAYIKFILESIRSRDLFHSIQIEPTTCWSYLFWMNQVSLKSDSLCSADNYVVLTVRWYKIITVFMCVAA